MSIAKHKTPSSGYFYDTGQSRMMRSQDVTIELKRLLRQSSHYVAGLGGGLTLGFISFPIFARAFSVADYGIIDFVQKLLLLLTATSKFGLQNSALRFYNVRDFTSNLKMARRYYSTMFFGITLTALGAAAVFIAGFQFTRTSLIQTSLAGVLLVGALLFLRSMQSIFWCFLRVEERTKAYSIISVALKAATLVSVCFLLAWSGHSSPQIYFAGAVAVELPVVAMFTVSLVRRRMLSPGSFDLSFFKESLIFGAPLVFYEIAAIVLDSGDRVLVRQYLGPEALGLYSVAYGLASHVNELLVAPLGLALVPIYMKLWARDGDKSTADFLSIALDVFLMISVGVVAAAATLSRDLLIVLASPKYIGAERLIPIIVGGLLLYATYLFIGAGLLIHKRTAFMSKVMFLCAAVNGTLNCVLLPRIGVQAAAWATVLSYALCIVLLARESHRVLPLKLELTAFTRYVCAAFITWVVASLIQFPVPLVNLICKAPIVLLSYCGLLYLLDSRVRQVIAQSFRRSEEPAGSDEVALQVEENEVTT